MKTQQEALDKLGLKRAEYQGGTNKMTDKIAQIIAEESGKSPEVIEKAIDEAKQMLKEPPTKEQVIQWFESDLRAAHYALSAIISTPILMRQIAETFYTEVTNLKQMPVEEKTAKPLN